LIVYRLIASAGLLAALLLTGCHMRPFWMRDPAVSLPPEAFLDTPTSDELAAAVNANTNRVQQLQTDSASLRVQGVPAMRANLAFQSPRNLRLRAELSAFTGQELDLGSNDQLFWFWVRRNSQPAVYFARHDQFATSPARSLIPIEPVRIVEALGLVHVDPVSIVRGPTRVNQDLLEVQQTVPSSAGDMTRVLRIHARYGWIAEQYLYDGKGQLVLSAKTDQHRFYAEDGVTLPHHLEIQIAPGQPSQLAFEVDVTRFLINRLYGERVDRWTVPQMTDFPLIDIAAPGFRPPIAAQPIPTPGSAYASPRTSGRLPYRGTYNYRR